MDLEMKALTYMTFSDMTCCNTLPNGSQCRTREFHRLVCRSHRKHQRHRREVCQYFEELMPEMNPNPLSVDTVIDTLGIND